jgi:hypothetical protein
MDLLCSMAEPVDILGNHVASTQNIIHHAEFHPTNTSPATELHGPQSAEGPDQF